MEFSLLKATPAVKSNLTGFLRTYVRTNLTTTYFLYMPVFNVLFLINAKIIVYILTTYFPSIPTNVGLLNIFGQVAFLPNLVYIMFIQSIYSGYTDSIKFYLSYLQLIEKISLLCNAAKLDIVFPALMLMIDFSDNLREEQLPISYHVLSPKYPSVITLEDEVKRLPFGMGVRYLLSYLRHVLDPLDQAHATLNDLVSVQHSLETSQFITEPTYLNNQNTLLLFAWYGIWLPISLVITAGPGPTIVLYPILSYVLWGPAILRMWLSSAWSNTRPFEVNNEHEEWPEEFKKSIKNIVDMRTSILKKFPTAEPEIPPSVAETVPAVGVAAASSSRRPKKTNL